MCKSKPMYCHVLPNTCAHMTDVCLITAPSLTPLKDSRCCGVGVGWG